MPLLWGAGCTRQRRKTFLTRGPSVEGNFDLGTVVLLPPLQARRYASLLPNLQVTSMQRQRVTPHLLTASYIYFLLYCRLLSTPTQVPIATGKQYRVLVRPLDTARQAGMPEAAAAARWPAARCHLLECSGQEGLAAVRNGPGTPGRPRPPTEQDSDASAPGAGAEPCGAPVPLAPPPPLGGADATQPASQQNRAVPSPPSWWSGRACPVPLGPNRKK